MFASERIACLVYRVTPCTRAVPVPRHAVRLARHQPPERALVPVQFFFTLVFTYPAFPQSLVLPTGQVDLDVWKNVMINLEGNANATFATDTYNRLVPEPAGPQVACIQLTCRPSGLSPTGTAAYANP